ncbi:hypothetical protein BKA62DRAFT_694987 [Auriculariales sp. MPI-PUGE-AT-0066]|nr:hypothetical protein BKA62DRAFT_694987 [Auriculariales sp. MPI-PUGE-AT-0066]
MPCAVGPAQHIYSGLMSAWFHRSHPFYCQRMLLARHGRSKLSKLGTFPCVTACVLPSRSINTRPDCTPDLAPDPPHTTMSQFRDAKTLDALFPPNVRSPPSPLSPSAAPGASEESARALAKWLKENHVNFHCFFNSQRFHNHLAHHLLAAYKLGAKPSLIQAAYEEHAPTQVKAFPSPGKIDEGNWKEHLGDDKYYQAYLDFFAHHVLKDGIASALNKYVFSDEANWADQTDAEKAPRMLDRFFSGVLHPLIHFGHGPEFGIPGMAVEGLAWTAVHNPTAKVLLPPEIFQASNPVNGEHSFTLLSMMLEDTAFAPGKIFDPDETEAKLAETFNAEGDRIYSYAKLWNCDISDATSLASRLEEISWLAALTYGVGGWSQQRPFKADFFLMHLVTSSLFAPSIISQLDKKSQALFLRGYAIMTFAVWVSRGRPRFDIKAFLEKTSTSVLPPVESPKPDKACLDQENMHQNAWYALLQSTLSHPDEHLVKAQRALVHYATLYGDRPKGYWSGTKLEGAEELDGSLFVRASGLTLKALGRVREGEPAGGWDFDGFYTS